MQLGSQECSGCADHDFQAVAEQLVTAQPQMKGWQTIFHRKMLKLTVHLELADAEGIDVVAGAWAAGWERLNSANNRFDQRKKSRWLIHRRLAEIGTVVAGFDDSDQSR